MRHPLRCLLTILALGAAAPAHADGAVLDQRLQGLDAFVRQTVADWNVPGAAVGVVVKDRLVFARGYGYRDVDHKLPVTPRTLFQIASNTKLFTAVSAGMLVDEKKLEWDQPVRRYVPDIHFHDAQLDAEITMRDMLSHRTGISRHDLIWYKSDFTRQELFDRLRDLEPSQPMRTGFLYNNMMYMAAGHVVEELSGRSWESFVRERIFTPLGMRGSMFTIRDMVAQPDHALPYNEKRDTTLLVRIPLYEEAQGIGPAGSIVSNVEDLSHWLVALMNGGRYQGRQVLPAATLQATLEPAMAMPNVNLETRGWSELLNSAYGMGRWTASYRGHFIAYHGGDLPGFHSQISCMPLDSIGVIVFVIGDHSQPLYNAITFGAYERLLGMEPTPWVERRAKDRDAQKAAGREGRKKSEVARVPGTHPSHPLADFAGEYEHPAYGVVTITARDTGLAFRFHHIAMPLHHYHFDRFDSPDDENDGLWSFNFTTSAQGEIDGLTSSLDESQVRFTRRADATLRDARTLAAYTGRYQLAGTFVTVTLENGTLFVITPGAPRIELVPFRPRVFKVRQFDDLTLEFLVESGQVRAIQQTDPSGQYRLDKVK